MRDAVDAAVEALLGAAARGAVLTLVADRIHTQNSRMLTSADRLTLATAQADQPAIVRALTWRVAVMRRQIRPRPEPIPLLVARPDVPPSRGCLSCGEPLSPIHDTRCALCALAGWIVLGSHA